MAFIPNQWSFRMPSDVMQPFMAPFTKLAQSNLELLTKFSLSPEMVSQAMTQAQRMFNQQPSATPMAVPPNALADLMMGLMKNYMEFLMELGQGSATLMQQAPATLAKATQQAARQAATVPPTA
ncbi:hypothetical protein [Azohydromonas lata]|uniref:Phasin protein n=1 Tax=Azohydromonas lata TaxID=45677 RepID=A0ABU5II74_9BURK|nr:hypothetical protein [Azohydromonas lata]MDZ5458633.1 hypothetical protein [Azohydromonas lata]